MTKSQLLAALAAGLLAVGLGVSSVPAQQQPTGSARGPLRAAPTVAMLDLKYVMENLTRFKALQSDMKVDVDRAEEQFRSERQAINNLAERLRNFKPGTPDYKGLEAEIVDRRTRFNVEQQMQKRDFLQQEAKIYHAIYQDICQEVSYYAAANNIDIVLQFNRDKADPNSPETVVREMSKSVVWFGEHLDISEIIRQGLERRSTPRPAMNRRDPLRNPQLR